jgi:hypothetical protein
LKIKLYIALFICFFNISPRFAYGQDSLICFDFFGYPVKITVDRSFIIPLDSTLNETSIVSFSKAANEARFQPIIEALLSYKSNIQMDDWLYYQLIRKTAQQISPKKDNYYRYTLYKWFLLNKSGYDAAIRISKNKIMFYVRTDDNIYNIPFYTKDGRQYVCLNYHDYGNNVDFIKEKFTNADQVTQEGGKAFSYKVTRLPDFKTASYQEKDIQFNYYQCDYHFKIKLNPEIKSIFSNYPVVDFASYCNIPLSNETYRSLIPLLKENVRGMKVKNGVDYLMHFTRYAFLFKTDSENFGAEKRLTPEQTLLYDESDCDDRAALFFYLVKEIYNLPMIVLDYPEHVTVAVKFSKAFGKPIVYNGDKYSVCEPTPQRTDLRIGKLLSALTKEPYTISYVYNPKEK